MNVALLKQRVIAKAALAAVAIFIPHAHSFAQEAASRAPSTSLPLSAVVPQPTPPNFADIVRRVSRAVVTIDCDNGGGSGFVVDSAGYVVTNDHVISGARACEVRFPAGEKYSAIWARSDAPRTDIALLKIEAPKPLPTVTFGDHKQVHVGDWVLAVGSPANFEGTVTAGIVSARSRDLPNLPPFTEWLQIDAAINHGNSGGPTFDMSGHVIGMNTRHGGYFRFSPELGFGERHENINFAIPVSTIKSVIAELRTGPVQRGFLGVLLEKVTENNAQALGLSDTKGALVFDVIEGSPAAQAGIKPDDVIRKVNGHTVVDDRDCLRQIAALKDNRKASLVIWRESKTIDIVLNVANRDDFISADRTDVTKATKRFASLGLDLAQPSPNDRQVADSGVVVVRVDPDSDAARLGLSPGDQIMRIGGRSVNSLNDVALAIERANSLDRKRVLIYVRTRLGGSLHVAVELKR